MKLFKHYLELLRIKISDLEKEDFNSMENFYPRSEMF